MVEAVQEGRLKHRGEWTTFADTLASFPPSLQKWTIMQITPLIGEEATQYLLSFASTPRGRYTVVQEVEVL